MKLFLRRTLVRLVILFNSSGYSFVVIISAGKGISRRANKKFSGKRINKIKGVGYSQYQIC